MTVHRDRPLDAGVGAGTAASRSAHSSPVGTVVERASTALSMKDRFSRSLTLPVLLVIALIVVIGATQSHLFIDQATWTNVLRSASYPTIVVCFEGLIMIAGGLDLSVGSTLLAGAMISAEVANSGAGTLLAVLAALGVGAGVGLVNGVLTNWFMISPIIATLGTMFAVSAVVITLSHGLAIGPLPNGFVNFGNTSVGAIPGVFIYAIIIAAVVHIILERTTFGTKIRAIGGNREAANKLGLGTRVNSIMLYILSGAASAFAGMLQAANLGAGDPSFGADIELQAIAAAVIGGVSIYGAIGTVPGMVAGSILLSLITIGLVLLHIAGSMQDFVVGCVLIVAVAIDRIRTIRMFKASLPVGKKRGEQDADQSQRDTTIAGPIHMPPRA